MKISNTHRKLFTSILLISLNLFFFSRIYATEKLLDIDFTRDSTYWKSQFPETSYNGANLVAPVTDYVVGDYKFSGNFGKFNKAGTTYGQPIYIETGDKIRRWAFRLNNSGDTYFELPELASVGRFTVFCKNANNKSETEFYIQRHVNGEWVNLKTVILPPHHNQNFEMQMEEFLNINEPVKLRIYGATRNTHLYEVSAYAYDASQPKEKPLKIILIPDAQTYANQAHLTHIYGNITTWINRIADDVKFVIQQGDITQLNNEAQWNIAAGAYNLLEGRKIPFTFCAGNHDMGRHGDSRITTLMNTYLPYSRYSRYDYFGGTFESNTVDNTWHTFSRGDYKFLILSLEYLPRNKVLDWANNVVAEHPDYNVIINTHSYLAANNTLNTGIPQEGLQGTGDETPNNGAGIWDKLVRKHSNIRFVFSGHVLGDGAGYRVTQGDNGNWVYQFIANYQGGVDGTQDSRNGMLRILDLEPENKRFSIKTYSPYQDKFNSNIDHQYYYTDVDFIKVGEPETYKPEPSGMISEDFSSAAWEAELTRLNPGTSTNPNATNPVPYATPAIGGANAYNDLNSIDLYFNKYKLIGAIETLEVLPCASVDDIIHANNNVAVGFRLKNDAEGLIEFPEIPNAGTFTMHVRNGNSNNMTWLKLEKLENENWLELNRFELNPNGALRTSRDEVLTYQINSETPIKLRLRNDGTRYVNLYRINIGEYNISSGVSATRNNLHFKISGRKITTEKPVLINIYGVGGNILFKKFIENEYELPSTIGKGVYIIQSAIGNQKIILK